MGEPFALYVHWPFCLSKCPYCDFNSHVREAVDQDGWRKSLLIDLAYEAKLLPHRSLGSIFFGGGTPSLMPPTTVAALIETAATYWPLVDDLEITLEANPSSVEAGRFADLAAAGVNRVSLGIQAFDDERLAFLGRAHSAREGLDAIETAQRNFARVSFDLIYALPGDTEEQWSRDLDRAIGLGTEHLSLYQLTIEPGTRFAAMAAKGALTPLDADYAGSLFELTQARTAAAGIPAYEISNHARPGAESRHNLVYWRYADYAGIGPGAHGRREGTATLRHRKPENWLAAINRKNCGVALEETLTDGERATEALVMGLRLAEGIDLQGRGLEPFVNRDAIARLAEQGLLVLNNGRIAATSQGMLLLDAVLREIVA